MAIVLVGTLDILDQYCQCKKYKDDGRTVFYDMSFPNKHNMYLLQKTEKEQHLHACSIQVFWWVKNNFEHHEVPHIYILEVQMTDGL